MDNRDPDITITEITVDEVKFNARIKAKLSGDARDSDIKDITEGINALGAEVLVNGVTLHCDSCHTESKESFRNIAEAIDGAEALGWIAVGSDHQCPGCKGYSDLAKSFKD